MSTASFACTCVGSSFVDIGNVDGLAHALHQQLDLAGKVGAEHAKTRRDATGRTGEHYRGCVGLVRRSLVQRERRGV
jgi:hypothetical protein